MASKRPSMKGMGADTFFETPASQSTGMPVKQEDSKTVEQQGVTPANKDTGLTSNQYISKPVNQQTGKPVEQEDSTTIEQQDVLPARQNVNKPANQQTGKPEDELIKATFYLTQEHIMKLERIRLGRKQHGLKIDKSALVREAIDLLKE
jgi:hypothetical protein